MMKVSKIKGTLLIAVLLITTLAIAMTVGISGLIEHLDMAGGTVTVLSEHLCDLGDETPEAFIDEPEDLVLDNVAFDAQSTPVKITGTLSDLVLGAGWVDTAYVEIGVRPKATKTQRNAGVYMIFFAHPDLDYFVHLQDYTGQSNTLGFHVAKGIGPYKYKITLDPNPVYGGKASLELLDKDDNVLGSISDYDYGWSSTWKENTEPVAEENILDEDFSEAYLFYSIIADRRGVADQTYSATVGDVKGATYGMELDDDFYHTDDTVTVTVGDLSANENPAVKEFLWPIGVLASSTEHNIDIALQETGLDTGIFTGTFKLVDYTPGTGELLVADGDTIDVTFVGFDPVSAKVDDASPVVDITSPEDLEFVHGEEFSITYTVAEIEDWNVSVSIDGVEIAKDIDDLMVTWNTTKNLDGLHTITVVATDGAENSGSDYVTVNVDNTGPSVTDYASKPHVVPPGLAKELILTASVSDDVLLGVTGYGIWTVTIDLTDVGGGDLVPMLDDASGQDETAGDGIYTASVTTPTTLTKGLYNFTITATDGLGNFNDEEAIVLNVVEDSVKPTIVSADVEYAVGAVSARPDDNVTVTIVATDDLSGVASVSINATEIGLTASEAMTGPVEYTWTATLTVGSVTVGTKTLNITATDYADNEEFVLVEVEVTAQLQGLYIDLEEGWNMFSLPLIPDDSSIEVVLADVMENVEIVWGYKDGAWSKYLPSLPEFSALTDLVDGEGYWVLMNADDTVTVSGVELPGPGLLPPVYDVVEGWNLIGFKSVESMLINEYLTTIPGYVKLSAVSYGWDSTVQAYEMVYLGAFLDDLFFYPGQGYWLYLTEDASIAPPTS